MSVRAFVDTNVLVYAHDRSTGKKHEAARALVESLWEERSGVISTQVLQELYVNLRRKTAHPLPRQEARQLLSDYLRWDLVVNTGDSILEAMEIEERYRLSFWDALIIHAAQAAAAETLYSEDLGHGQRYGPVRIVNPFQD
jgi:predicted nucleic acid-binding protein